MGRGMRQTVYAATPRDETRNVAARIHELLRTDVSALAIDTTIAADFAHAPEAYAPVLRTARSLLAAEGRESALVWTAARAAVA